MGPFGLVNIFENGQGESFRGVQYKAVSSDEVLLPVTDLDNADYRLLLYT